MEIIPDRDNIENKLKEIKDIIEVFNKNIDNIINIMNKIKKSIEKYYIINYNIWKNYDIKRRNYYTFKNVNNINKIKENRIIEDIREIIKEKDMKKKMNEIYNLKEKIEKENIENKKEIKKEIKENMIKSNDIKVDEEKIKYRNEINIIYKTKEKGKQKIFGEEFVKNNKEKIELIINNKKSNLIDEYELVEGRA